MTTNATQKSTTKQDLSKSIIAALDVVQTGKSHKAEIDKFFLAVMEKPIGDALNDVLNDLTTSNKVRQIARRAFWNTYRGWTAPTNEPISTPNRVKLAFRLVVAFGLLLVLSIGTGLGVAKIGHHIDPSGTGFGSAAAIGWITILLIVVWAAIAGGIAYGQYLKYKAGPKPVAE